MGHLARICAVAATAVAVDPAEGFASPTLNSPTTRVATEEDRRASRDVPKTHRDRSR